MRFCKLNIRRLNLRCLPVRLCAAKRPLFPIWALLLFVKNCQFVDGKPEKVKKMEVNLLEQHGGFLFDGIRLDAPPEWKKTINK